MGGRLGSSIVVLTAYLCAGFGIAVPPLAHAQAAHAPSTSPSTVTALMVSDIHFDPFHDPEQAKALAAAAPEKWRALLAGPASPNQKQAFEALQQACHARGVDTPYALFDSSLVAMRAQAGDAKFMTVSGDLIAHGFPCRYAKIFPNAATGDYQAFVLKTLSFVIAELRAEFPGMPVYVSLGNNDSGCGDYQLDPGSSFLAEAGKILAEGLPPSEREQASTRSEVAAS